MLLEQVIRFVRISVSMAVLRGWARGTHGRDSDPLGASALLNLHAPDPSDAQLPALVQARAEVLHRLERVIPGTQLDRLVQLLSLNLMECLGLLVLGVAEIDPWTRAMLRKLRSKGEDGPLTLSLLHDILAGAEEPWQQPEIISSLLREGSMLLHPGLVSQVGSGTFVQRGLVPTKRLIRILCGVQDAPTAAARHACSGTFDEDVALLSQQIVNCSMDKWPPVLIVLGPAGSGRRTLAEEVVRRVPPGRAVLQFDLGRLDRWPQVDDLRAALFGATLDALLLGRVLLITHEAGAGDEGPTAEGQRQVLAEVLRQHRDLLVVVSTATRPTFDTGARSTVVHAMRALPRPARLALWHHALSGLPVAPDTVAGIADAFRLRPALIGRAARTAMTLRAQPGAVLDSATIMQAVIQILDSDMGGLGKRVDTSQRWEDLVVPIETQERIEELLARIRLRRSIYEQWGFARKLGSEPGIVALLYGEPGTGKTMTAKLVAQELGLVLIRVDLSQVVSKWVGETEKNLGAVFDAAEEAQSILLLDEADSLLTKRTEVQNASDRYANLAVNYILQRLDEFTGIALLTTNKGQSLDPALERRITFRLFFPAPEEDSRAALWRQMIPREAPRHQDIDYAYLARHQLTGGLIRNAVLRSAFLAALRGEPITMHHLEHAVRMELEDAGRIH